MQNINKQIQKINDTSLAKIIFFKEPCNDIIDELGFYNIIFAANGVFIALKNDFGASIDKINDIKYTNSQLLSFESDSLLYLFVPKPPISLLVKILEIFKYIYNKIKAELCINIYYNKKNNTFHLNINEQVVNSMSANYEYDEDFEMSEDYIRYLQIHSHHSMSANFSQIDDKDESLTTLCYYGVIGKISNTSEFYNIETKFRIWNGIRFIDCILGEIFNLGIEENEISNEIVLKLDSIIEDSKQRLEEKKDNISLNRLSNFSRYEKNSEIDPNIVDMILGTLE